MQSRSNSWHLQRSTNRRSVVTMSKAPSFDPPSSRVALLVRHIALVGLAGVVVGVVVGGGRLVMGILAAVAPDRVTGRITENGNRVGELTMGGTIELLVFVGVFAGAVGAVSPPLPHWRCSWPVSPQPLEHSVRLRARPANFSRAPSGVLHRSRPAPPRQSPSTLMIWTSLRPVLSAFRSTSSRT